MTYIVNSVGNKTRDQKELEKKTNFFKQDTRINAKFALTLIKLISLFMR